MSDEILTVLVADKTVYTMAQYGELPAFRVRGKWRFRRTDIDAWMASQVATEAPRRPQRPRGARK